MNRDKQYKVIVLLPGLGEEFKDVKEELRELAERMVEVSKGRNIDVIEKELEDLANLMIKARRVKMERMEMEHMINELKKRELERSVEDERIEKMLRKFITILILSATVFVALVLAFAIILTF